MDLPVECVPNLPGIRDFLAQVAAPRPAPGGGAVAALAGALSAALSEMATGLAAAREGNAQARELAVRAGRLRESLLELTEEDPRAVRHLMEVLREKNGLDGQREQALYQTAWVSVHIAEASLAALRLAENAVKVGYQPAIGDAAAAVYMAEAAIRTAITNARLNVRLLRSPEQTGDVLDHVERVQRETRTLMDSIRLDLTNVLGA